MAERSRRPKSHGAGLKEEVVCEIVRLSAAHRSWGPKKIRELYSRRHRGESVPSESSFKRVLERAGMTQKRKRKRAQESGRISTGRRAKEPNEVWTVDFKGRWFGIDGQRVEPLTVRDEYSRMVLDVRLLENAKTETVRACFERLFEEYGLPKAIRSDNGAPFASSWGPLGLSRLSAWWLALGIDLERSRPGCPQDNGAHERMHLDLSLEFERGEMGDSQESFDVWRQEYDTVRPHEALGMACPAERYRKSERRYQGTPEEIDYGAMAMRRVSKTGMISYGKTDIWISQALGGWNVGLSPRDDGKIDVWFARLLLGHIDMASARFTPTAADGEKARAGHRADSATLHRPDGQQSKDLEKNGQKV